jgi:hypothetical protein
MDLIRTSPPPFSFNLSKSCTVSDISPFYSVRVVRIPLRFGHPPLVFHSSCPNHALLRTSPLASPLELAEPRSTSDNSTCFPSRVGRIPLYFGQLHLPPLSSWPNPAVLRTTPSAFPPELAEPRSTSDISTCFPTRVGRTPLYFGHLHLLPHPSWPNPALLRTSPLASSLDLAEPRPTSDIFPCFPA